MVVPSRSRLSRSSGAGTLGDEAGGVGGVRRAAAGVPPPSLRSSVTPVRVLATGVHRDRELQRRSHGVAPLRLLHGCPAGGAPTPVQRPRRTGHPSSADDPEHGPLAGATSPAPGCRGRAGSGAPRRIWPTVVRRTPGLHRGDRRPSRDSPQTLGQDVDELTDVGEIGIGGRRDRRSAAACDELHVELLEAGRIEVGQPRSTGCGDAPPTRRERGPGTVDGVSAGGRRRRPQAGDLRPPGAGGARGARPARPRRGDERPPGQALRPRGRRHPGRGRAEADRRDAAGQPRHRGRRAAPPTD